MAGMGCEGVGWRGVLEVVGRVEGGVRGGR